MLPKIVSIASINIDEVYRVPHIVKPGETISSTGRQQNAGGKGANASVAAARAGGRVHVVGNIGHDGLWVRDLIARSGANVDQITALDDVATGRAIIQVDPSGENSIFLFPGANYCFEAKDARKAFAQCNEGDWLLLTNETTGVADAIIQAHKCGLQILWNPAPMTADMVASKMPVDLVDVLVLNESELLDLARQLDDIDVSKSDSNGYVRVARQVMSVLGSCVIIVTLGSDGSIGLVRRSGNNTHEIPISSNSASQEGASESAINHDSIIEIRMECAPVKKEQIKDTTAAGDTWVGYFAAELAQLQHESPESVGSLATITPTMVEHAMRFATYASGIAVSRFGAAPSIPLRAEVESFLKTKILP
ncbi:putative ribokinase [Coemansia guatemalensis]|uniref:Ribokinase n=1 Tax=Coemansia guatemalensis TaxID=2761395 RepID=A0A9W8HY30_9FUNG|nr:putative ribokinase [Coemansia guatemalensis]